jgi:hypothetical protein
VIQALFYTEKAIDLEFYEETRVLSQGDSNMGDLLKVIPNQDEGGNYRVDIFDTKGGFGQRITLKNHVLQWKGTATYQSEDFFEVGARCCKFSTLVPMSQSLLGVEFGYVGVQGYVYNHWIQQGRPLPDTDCFLEFLQANQSTTHGIRPLKAIGDGPLGLQIPRAGIKPGHITQVANRFTGHWTQLQEELNKQQA